MDTLKTARDLRAAGLPQEQAEAVAQAIHEAHLSELGNLATKADLLAVKADLQAMKTGLQADLQAVKAGLQAELQAVKAELKSEIEILRRDLTIKLGAMLMVAVGILLAAIRYLPAPHG